MLCAEEHGAFCTNFDQSDHGVKNCFGTSSFNSCSSKYLIIIESPFPATEHTIALFSSKYSVSILYHLVFMWFHPEFDFKNICSSSVPISLCVPSEHFAVLLFSCELGMYLLKP